MEALNGAGGTEPCAELNVRSLSCHTGSCPTAPGPKAVTAPFHNQSWRSRTFPTFCMATSLELRMLRALMEDKSPPG